MLVSRVQVHFWYLAKHACIRRSAQVFEVLCLCAVVHFRSLGPHRNSFSKRRGEFETPFFFQKLPFEFLKVALRSFTRAGLRVKLTSRNPVSNPAHDNLPGGLSHCDLRRQANDLINTLLENAFVRLYLGFGQPPSNPLPTIALTPFDSHLRGISPAGLSRRVVGDFELPQKLRGSQGEEISPGSAEGERLVRWGCGDSPVSIVS